MTGYVKQIRSKLHLTTPLKALHLLDGAYEAVVKGQSMDFDDLRSYSAGDRRKDIDWKSSARSNTLLVKQYVAQKRMPIEFIMDTGLNMSGLTPSGENKHTVALETAGILAGVALNHSDTVGFIYGDNDTSSQLKQTASVKETDRTLNEIFNQSSHTGTLSNINNQLEHFIHTTKSRRIVVVISGAITPDDSLSDIIQRVKTKHDLYWVVIEDINPFQPTNNVVDVETGTKIPFFFKKNRKIQAAFIKAEQERNHKMKTVMEESLVPYVSVASTATVLDSIISLLLHRKYENR